MISDDFIRSFFKNFANNQGYIKVYLELAKRPDVLPMLLENRNLIWPVILQAGKEKNLDLIKQMVIPCPGIIDKSKDNIDSVLKTFCGRMGSAATRRAFIMVHKIEC